MRSFLWIGSALLFVSCANKAARPEATIGSAKQADAVPTTDAGIENSADAGSEVEAGAKEHALEAADDEGVTTFRSWEELPNNARASVPKSAFARGRVVLRVNVLLGCVARDGSARPKSGYLSPTMRDRCLRGTGQTHPLRIVGDNGYSDPVLSAESSAPFVRVDYDEGETSVRLSPPIVPPSEACAVPIVDIYWFSVRSGKAHARVTEGSNRCATD